MRNTLGTWFPKALFRIITILDWLKAFLFDFELSRDGINFYEQVVNLYLSTIEYQVDLLWESLSFLPIPLILRDALELQLLELNWNILYLGLYSDLSGGRNSVKSENSTNNFRRHIDRFLKFIQKLS